MKALLCLALLTLLACSPAETYTGALIRCVDQSDTLAESKACRQLVDSQYGVTVTVTKDAGR